SRSWGVDAGRMSRSSSTAILGLTGIRPLVGSWSGALSPGHRPIVSWAPCSATFPPRRRAEVTAGRSPPVDDLPAPGQPAWEGERHGAGARGVGRAHRLAVEVRLRAVARVAAACEAVADAHRLPRSHGDAPAPEMTQGHEHRPAPVTGPQDHVVARERGPALRGAAVLGEDVADRGKTSAGVVVLLPV